MSKKILVGICVFGFFLRLGYIFFVGADPIFPDEYRFLEEAESTKFYFCVDEKESKVFSFEIY